MNRFTFEFSAEIDQIEKADRWLEITLCEQNVQDTFKFSFACHELIINSVDAMIQNHSMEKLLRICILLEVSASQVAFTITDWGGGIPEDLLNPCSLDEIDPLQERGRGLALIYNMTDEFSCRKEVNGSHSYRIVMNR